MVAKLARVLRQNSPSRNLSINPPASQKLEEPRGPCQYIGCKQPAIATLPKDKFHEPLDACAVHFNSFLLYDMFLKEREKVRMYVN